MVSSRNPNTNCFTFLAHMPVLVSSLKLRSVNPDATFDGTININDHGVLIVGRRISTRFEPSLDLCETLGINRVGFTDRDLNANEGIARSVDDRINGRKVDS